MGSASPVIPSTTWELSRRCTGRKFLLKSDRKVTDALLYCFAFCADKWSIELHQLTVMHNHYHDTVTDALGTRVDFTADVHALIARCIKDIRGVDGLPMEGPVWNASEQTGRVLLVSEEAFIESAAYAIANPVAAGLVHNVSQWTGFVSRPRDMLTKRTITIRRPECLPDAYPETATLRFCLPPALEDRGRAVVEAIERRAQEKQREARKEVLARGGRFKTREELLAVNAFDAPKTRKGRRDVIVPALRAAKASVMRAAKKQLLAWRQAYRVAFEGFRNGNRDIEWPCGTWFYARYAGVRVAPADNGLWAGFRGG